MTAEKNVYIVLGMARSGTSAIARALKALGVELGNKLIPADAAWNAKGFFEDNDIVYKVNRRVLDVLDQSSVGAKLIDEAGYQKSELVFLNKMATNLLKERIADTQHWGFKDPRTAKILPFWQRIFSELKVNEHYVLALRNPLASAYSYQKVSGTDLEVGLMLWVMHMIPAIEGTQGKKRIMVSYDEVMKNPKAQLERMKHGLTLSDLAAQGEVDKYANEFLDKKLRHYEYNDAEFKSHAAVKVVPICIKMYDLFMKVAKDEINLESEAFAAEWRALKEEFDAAYATYCYIDLLLNKNKAYERRLRTIKKSLPWKLLFPLRLIDDALRAYRKKSREKRRWAKAYG